LHVEFDPKLAPYIVSKVKLRGSSRQLRNIMRTEIEDPLSMSLISFPEGELYIGLEGGKIVFARPELVGEF
jgi:ATP-dependent Clp protease ATP-binding subunit ClpC